MQLTALEDVAELEIAVYVECALPPPPKAARGYVTPFRATRRPSKVPGAADADAGADTAADGGGGGGGGGVGGGASAAAGGADKDAVDGDRSFVLAFAGSVCVNGGRDLGPCGGRFHLVLHPRPEDLIASPSPAAAAAAAALAAAPPLRVYASVLPVALPSSQLLTSFRAPLQPAPCYPSALLDAECLDTEEVRGAGWPAWKNQPLPWRHSHPGTSTHM